MVVVHAETQFSWSRATRKEKTRERTRQSMCHSYQQTGLLKSGESKPQHDFTGCGVGEGWVIVLFSGGGDTGTCTASTQKQSQNAKTIDKQKELRWPAGGCPILLCSVWRPHSIRGTPYRWAQQCRVCGLAHSRVLQRSKDMRKSILPGMMIEQ